VCFDKGSRNFDSGTRPMVFISIGGEGTNLFPSCGDCPSHVIEGSIRTPEINLRRIGIVVLLCLESDLILSMALVRRCRRLVLKSSYDCDRKVDCVLSGH